MILGPIILRYSTCLIYDDHARCITTAVNIEDGKARMAIGVLYSGILAVSRPVYLLTTSLSLSLPSTNLQPTLEQPQTRNLQETLNLPCSNPKAHPAATLKLPPTNGKPTLHQPSTQPPAANGPPASRGALNPSYSRDLNDYQYCGSMLLM